MELLKELFVTGFIALVFSFLVAKLVSIVMSPDDPSNSAAVRDADVADPQQDLHAADKLQVHGSKAEEVTDNLENSSERVRLEEFRPKEAPETEREEEEAVDRGEFAVPAAAENAGIKEGDPPPPEREVEIDDDWEGIERSEVEEAFRKAARLVESREEDERLAGDGYQLELYGLHRVATEGPCRENPPLALKLSARSKWNAWQRLGNMTPEAAMEKYVALVTERVPGWIDGKTNSDSEARSSGAGDASSFGLDSSTVSSNEIDVINERNAEPRPDPVENDLNEVLSSGRGSENDKETLLAAA